MGAAAVCFQDYGTIPCLNTAEWIPAEPNTWDVSECLMSVFDRFHFKVRHVFEDFPQCLAVSCANKLQCQHLVV